MTYEVINNKFQRVPGQDPDWKPYLYLAIGLAVLLLAFVVGVVKLAMYFK